MLFTEDNCEYTQEEMDTLNQQWRKRCEHLQLEDEALEEDAKQFADFVAAIYPDIDFSTASIPLHLSK